MKQLAIAALALAACAAAPEPADPLLAYVRANRDGTLAERIYVYRPDAAHLEVGKMVANCTNAAFVTAELDLERGQPRQLVGGRLARDGGQEAFATLTYDPATRLLRARVPPAGVDQSIAIEGEPWLIYDFDLAELSGLFYGRAPPREDFRFAVALLWPEPGAENVFRDLGFMHARYAGAEPRLGRETLRFDVSGALSGQLWLDARQGFVVEAEFDQPNHVGYDDFHLVLQDVRSDGAAAWAQARAAHWRDCPPPQ